MKSAESTPLASHVDVLDGLRALAIGMVVWLHTWQLSWMGNSLQLGALQLEWGFIPETGFLGVELFFFISGFCLFYPYARHLYEGKPLPTLGSYIYRRAIKILPSYWLAIALLIASTGVTFGTLTDWAWQLGTHFLFIHNWFHETKDTFDGVFWSLGVEIQFYVLFPLICRAFGRSPLLTYGLLCGLATLWRYGVNEWVPVSDGNFWLNQLPGYIDFFANGLVAAYALVAWRGRAASRLRPWLMTLGALLGFAILGKLMLDVYAIRHTQDYWPVGWQVEHRTYLGFAFLLIALTSAGAVRPWRLLLANAPLAFMSTISYNLYIWHQVIARWLYTHHWPAARMTDPHADPTWQWQFMAAAIGLSIAFSALVTYSFERPLLKYGVLGLVGRLRPRRALAPVAETPTP